MNKRIIIYALCSLIWMTTESKACTAFLVNTKKTVLVGNNEDGSNPETRIWTVATGTKGTYGRVCFGFNDLSAQGGVNEKGLWFDAFGLPYEPGNAVMGKVFAGDLQDLLLAECATVDEVVAILKIYNRSQMTRYQWMFGDRNGNSIIVEADTIVYKQGNYQVVTNFRNSKFPSGKGYECGRYQTANKLLSTSHEANIQTCRKILSDTHSEGQDITLYSYIADLTAGKIYVYHFHNFENPLVLDIKKEVAQGNKVYKLADLFPTTVAAESHSYYAKKSLDEIRASRYFPAFDIRSLASYSGTYSILEPETMVGQLIKVSPADTALNLTLNDGGYYELLPDSPSTFAMLGYGGLDFKCSFTYSQTAVPEFITLQNAGLLVRAKRID